MTYIKRMHFSVEYGIHYFLMTPTWQLAYVLLQLLLTFSLLGVQNPAPISSDLYQTAPNYWQVRATPLYKIHQLNILKKLFVFNIHFIGCICFWTITLVMAPFWLRLNPSTHYTPTRGDGQQFYVLPEQVAEGITSPNPQLGW